LLRPMFSSLDLGDSDYSEMYGAIFFSNELARLFKLPTTAPVLKLAEEVISSYEALDDIADKDTILSKIADSTLDVFDSVLMVCKALRAIANPRPYPHGTKNVADMFTPPPDKQQPKGVADVANSVRSSKVWGPLLDEYWGASVSDDRFADSFMQTAKDLTVALDTEAVDVAGAVVAVDQLTKFEARSRVLLSTCPQSHPLLHVASLFVSVGALLRDGFNFHRYSVAELSPTLKHMHSKSNLGRVLQARPIWGGSCKPVVCRIFFPGSFCEHVAGHS
jgi:hypothetical protein